MIYLNIPDEVLKDFNLTYPEFFYMLFRTTTEVDPSEIEKVLLDKDIGSPCKRNPNEMYISKRDTRYINTVLSNINKQLKMEKTAINPDFIPLAKKMQALYPKGIRPGCSQQWRGSSITIARKLTNLTKNYYVEFTEEEALDAVKRYVESFNGDYHYMECLEYFILRTRPNFKSNFMSYLENTEEGVAESNDFMMKIR